MVFLGKEKGEMGMEVFALIGPSGTGKSHRAMTVAYEKEIKVVIDDGLLIKEGRKIAGKSAKREATTFAAVKRAIFYDREHAREVRESLAQLQPTKVLVLGTSPRMIQHITTALGLPKPSAVIKIEDIATPWEMNMARELRQNHGMHVIPVPTIELKADFPGYLLDPLKYFFKRRNETRQQMGERSILRPKFSLNGKLLVSEFVITQLVTYYVARITGITKINRIMAHLREEGVALKLEVTAQYPANLPDLAEKVQQDIREHLEYLTGLVVYGVQVVFKSLDF